MCVCVCLHAYVLLCPQASSLSPAATGTYWMDKRRISVTVHLHHLLGLPPLPICFSCLLSPHCLSLSLPNTPFLFRLLPRTDSIFLARSRTSPAQLIKLMHSYLDETIGFTPHRNSRSAGVLISMLEAIKGVTFPLL